MSTLESTAKRLGALYNARGEASLAAWHAEKDIVAREIALTPAAEGWPGKNAETRDAAKAATFAADPILQRLSAERDSAKEKLLALASQIEALEAERRASEWSIRGRLVDALERRGVAANGHGDRVEAAFDDTEQNIIDNDLDLEAYEVDF